MLIITTSRRQKQREDDAWSDGFHTGDEEVELALGEKDAFIEKQSGIITDLMNVLNAASAWELVPEELRNDLASYI